MENCEHCTSTIISGEMDVSYSTTSSHSINKDSDIKFINSEKQCEAILADSTRQGYHHPFSIRRCSTIPFKRSSIDIATLSLVSESAGECCQPAQFRDTEEKSKFRPASSLLLFLSVTAGGDDYVSLQQVHFNYCADQLDANVIDEKTNRSGQTINHRRPQA